MPVRLKDIDTTLRKLLKPEEFDDYCPNGIQVEGKEKIQKIVTGVTASRALIEAAIVKEADLILVHHGYFWKGEEVTITGLKKVRIQLLLSKNISLFAYHLPLDAHPRLGNNAQLAKILGIIQQAPLDAAKKHPLVLSGNLSEPQSFNQFEAFLESKLGQKPISIEGRSKNIKSIVWCSGAAQGFIEQAVGFGADAYLTGEVSEQTVHIARESGIHFFAAGHHATERYGVQALGEYLANEHSISHTFIDIPNPV